MDSLSLGKMTLVRTAPGRCQGAARSEDWREMDGTWQRRARLRQRVAKVGQIAFLRVALGKILSGAKSASGTGQQDGAHISIAAGICLVIKNLVLQIANVQSDAISLQGGLGRGKSRQAYDTFLPGADVDAGLLKINGAHAPNNEGDIIDGE